MVIRERLGWLNFLQDLAHSAKGLRVQFEQQLG
jgi:hypothetical protein